MKSFTLSLAVCALLAAADAHAVTMAWSPVGNPGNAADLFVPKHGAVGYTYNIGTYDVTNSQYVEFLNAKDQTGANPLGLYNSNMSNATVGGINFTAGNANGNKYSVISGDGNHPVNYVTWYDSIRFANWMNNGQGSDDTETGAYTLLGGTPTPSNGNSITRNVGATVFLPSENEWFKAAYYNPGTSSYFQYPTGSNTAPTATSPTATPNSANISQSSSASPGGPNNLTDVGAYTGTTSPYGAFDMGANVFNWNHELIDNRPDRGLDGSSFLGSSLTMQSSFTSLAFFPSNTDEDYGFRLANIPTGYIPEPSSLVLAALGLIGLVAWGWRRRYA